MFHDVSFGSLVVGKSYVLKSDTAMYHAAWNMHVCKWFVDEKQPYKQSLRSGTVVLCVASQIIPDRRVAERRSKPNVVPEKVREIVFRDATAGNIWVYYILDEECSNILPTIFQIDSFSNSDDVPTMKKFFRSSDYSADSTKS